MKIRTSVSKIKISRSNNQIKFGRGELAGMDLDGTKIGPNVGLNVTTQSWGRKFLKNGTT
jgi:hypothetical protein